ncbi:unnamed protein product [Cuscuta epithymum]|uniref:Uncharacterized protein n=1 Tax=Cuscuta epithymum TaxID=186058 RepID=A0AAV0EKV8_9ASTE|nr:unnamed protein product [Cuscuta epithymum]
MASSSKSSFHPALAVTSIKNLIPLILDTEKVQYSSWAELFKITARAYDVLDHIIPPTNKPATTSAGKGDDTDDDSDDATVSVDPLLWDRLDAVVLQWIYGTISQDLLLTILEPDSTAMEAWTRLANIFQDNKHARAVHLEDEFSHVRLANFASISAYCQQLRTIATNLANVGAPVDHNRLILRLVNGLTAPFATIASMIQQTVPLPTFENARSMLLLEEGRQAHSVEHESVPSASALAATVPPPAQPPTSAPRPRGGGRNGTGRGRGRGRQSGPRPSDQSAWPQYPGSPWAFPPWAAWMQQFWPTPPCPYPTAPGHNTPPRSSSAGLLGPRPHALTAGYGYPTIPTGSTPSFMPTDLHTSMHTMSLNPPDDNWYMDTGATSHMTSDAGSSYRNPTPQV